MNVRAILVCALIAGFSVLPALSQQDTSRPETARFGDPSATARSLQDYVYGVVKKIGAAELILDKTEFGDDQSFKLLPKTKFVHDGKPSTLAQLKVGDQVWIDVKREKKTGDLIARKVVTGIQPTETKGGPQTR
ncbi:MAG TPA: hypothetical protein VGW33_03180 [Terriglobia bacterium]|nr:hypothetical protein [Terriglobia bacterium]